MFAAQYEPTDARGRRRAARTSVALDAHVGRVLCRVVDLSRHGAKLHTFAPLVRGTIIWLTLPHAGRIAAEVMWSDDLAAGCRFRTPLSVATFEALLALG